MILTYVLHMVFSWPWWIGSGVSLAVWLVYSRQKAVWLDRHRPLPDGGRHYASQLNQMWLAGVALVLCLGYMLLTAQNAHDQTVALALRVEKCWAESYKSAKAQIDINAQNDGISRQQQELQREYDRATSDWLKALVQPPGDLAKMDSRSPERHAWAVQQTAEYQVRIDDLGTTFDVLVAQRTQLDQARQRHPLPEATCGK